MKEYSMELCGVKRTLPFIPISEEMALSPQKRKVLP